MLQTLKYAVATACFSGNLKERLKAAADAGASAVQFDLREELRPDDLSESGRRQFLHLMRERGLSVASVTFPLRRSLTDVTELDARMNALRRGLEFAHQLGAATLSVRIGSLPTAEDAAGQQLLREVLSDLARYANHVGTALAIVSQRESPDRYRELLTSIQTGPIGLDFDPSVFAVNGQPAHQVFRALHDLVLHVTARDAMRDYDESTREVVLGRGEVDWIEFLPLLLEADYAGWITVQRTQGEDRAGDARRALVYLQNVLFS